MYIGVVLVFTVWWYLICQVRSEYTARCSKCECYRTKHHHIFDCTGKGLNQIPEVPPGVDRLVFNNNHITKLSRDSFKKLPQSIKSMYFNNCSISRIVNNNIFENVREQLKTFHIGENKLDKANFKYLFESVRHSNIAHLNISSNYMERFVEVLNFTELGQLNTIYMNNCNITSVRKIFATKKTRKWEHLEFSENLLNESSLKAFFEFGRFYPRLQQLRLSSNPISNIPFDTFSTLKRLFVLWLNDIRSNNSKFMGINSSSLKLLDISNSFSIERPGKYKSLFNHSTNIQSLDMSRTNFSKWTDNDFRNLFSPVHSIDSLSLAAASLTEIPCKMLPKNSTLRTLNISENNIVYLEGNCFDNMPDNLTKLYLANNGITSINSTSFPEEFLGKLLKLHLYGNKFHCNCSLHWFRYWMKAHYKVLGLLGDEENFIYQCHTPKNLQGMLLIKYDPTYEECNGVYPAVLATFSICGFCWAFIVAAFVLQNLHIFRRKEDSL